MPDCPPHPTGYIHPRGPILQNSGFQPVAPLLSPGDRPHLPWGPGLCPGPLSSLPGGSRQGPLFPVPSGRLPTAGEE